LGHHGGIGRVCRSFTGHVLFGLAPMIVMTTIDASISLPERIGFLTNLLFTVHWCFLLFRLTNSDRRQMFPLIRSDVEIFAI
jgi:uncharacterized membrane protein